MKCIKLLIGISVFISNYALAQESIQTDSLRPLKEIIITYQADKLTPITFQNIIQKDLKAKSTGQEPSFLPQKFIYDPGVIIGDINKHLEASAILSNHGYVLNSIIVLPDLYHQYCEFNFIN